MAQENSPSLQIKKGIQLYLDGHYRKAQKELKQAIDAGGLEKNLKIGAYQYLAFSQVALGNTDGAIASFQKILTIQ